MNLKSKVGNTPMIVNSNFNGTGCLANVAVTFPVPVAVGDHWDEPVQRRLVYNSARKHLASDSLNNQSLRARPKYADYNTYHDHGFHHSWQGRVVLLE